MTPPNIHPVGVNAAMPKKNSMGPRCLNVLV